MTSISSLRSTRRFHLLLALSATLIGLAGFATTASAHHKKKHHHKTTSTGSSSGWKWSKPFKLPGSPEVFALSCASTKLCVATGIAGATSTATNDVYSTTNPSGGTSAWQAAALQSSSDLTLAPGGTQEALDNASCEQAGVSVDCALTSGWDDLFQTSNPTGGAPAWGESQPTEISFVSLSCWSAYCGELDVQGDAVVTVGAQALSDQNVFNVPDGLSSQPGGISCNASAFCAAVDQSDDIAWTSDATDSPPTWSTATLSDDVDQIACPSATLCLAVEGQNSASGKTKIAVSTSPSGGAGTWKAFGLPDIGTVSCESATFCVALGDGVVYASTNPTDASASAWKKAKSPFRADDVSCPTDTECVIADASDISVGTR
jgi:hypothetical protein